MKAGLSPQSLFCCHCCSVTALLGGNPGPAVPAMLQVDQKPNSASNHFQNEVRGKREDQGSLSLEVFPRKATAPLSSPVRVWRQGKAQGLDVIPLGISFCIAVWIGAHLSPYPHPESAQGLCDTGSRQLSYHLLPKMPPRPVGYAGGSQTDTRPRPVPAPNWL